MSKSGKRTSLGTFKIKLDKNSNLFRFNRSSGFGDLLLISSGPERGRERRDSFTGLGQKKGARKS
jgi:hypothetical protein